MKRSNWLSFDRTLKQYGVERLYHFTDRANLPSIIKNRGLLSWGDCKEKGIEIAVPGGDSSSRMYDNAENGGYPPTQNGDIRSLFWLFSLI